MGMGGMHPGKAARFRQLMERYDTNQDGKVSQDEIDKNRAEWLARFDSDKDGSLSLKEFEALWLEAHRLQMVRDFQFLDRDGDGKVTLEEYDRPLAHLVRTFDRNGDGFLSKDDRSRPEGMRWRHRDGGDVPKEGADDDGQDGQNQGTGDQQQ
jgi:Ca2+-binding EF-hand superfamily protein